MVYFYLFHEYIVACQRGGVSNKPPWLQAATSHGPLTGGLDLTPTGEPPISRQTKASDKLQKIEKYGPTTGHVLLRKGEPGTSQYQSEQINAVSSIQSFDFQMSKLMCIEYFTFPYQCIRDSECDAGVTGCDVCVITQVT